MARRVGRPRTFDKQKVTRLAEKGAELDVIVAELGIPAAVVKARKAELKGIVEAGNLRFKRALTERLWREGIAKGRSHALLALARKHLGFDRPQNDATAEERYRAMIESGRTSLLKVVEKLEKNLQHMGEQLGQQQ